MHVTAIPRPILAATLLAALLSGCSSPTTTEATGFPRAGATTSASASASAGQQQELQGRLAALERRYGARVGAAVLDTGTGRRYSHRGDDRFAFASTDKVFIAAATLRTASDADLEQVVHYSKGDLLDYAPITGRHVATGMTVRALLDAALRFSDNTAANLLVERLGGPDGVERYLRSIGDRTTSVDRLEPDLNSAVPGDRRDTTTPSAFARDLQDVLLGTVLPRARRDLLNTDMRRNTTGGPYIRAGVPASWTVEDKTGAGSYGVRNDVAVLRPPHRPAVVVVLLTSRPQQDASSQDELIADATRAIVDVLE